MVKIYTCQACTENKHKDCELSKSSYPPGSYGGSFCRCPCKGDPHFDDPNTVYNQLVKMIEYAAKHEKDSKKVDLMVKEKSLSEMADELFSPKYPITPTPDEIEDAYHRALDKAGNIVSGVFDENPKPLSTYQQVRKLELQIEAAQKKIKEIQDKCKHPKIMPPTPDNTFPTRYRCASCKKQWWRLE